MSSTHKCSSFTHLTYIQSNQDNINFSPTRLSQKQPATYFSISSGRVNTNIRKDSVYGYGDVPGNERTRSKSRPENYSSRKKKDASGAMKEAIPNDIKDDKIDKRQRLLDWLKASQAKRDENNRQVFSRWIEKMDSMKPQIREQSACPAFYCDCLSPPHTLYSAANGYPGEIMGNSGIILGSPFMYQPQKEILYPQNFEYLLKQSQQLMEWSTFTDFGYYLPRFIYNHELCEHMYALKQQKKLENDDADAGLSAFGNPTALNFGAMVVPYPCMHLFPQNHDEHKVTAIGENDAQWDWLSGLGSKMLPPPLLYQPEFGFVLQAPSDCPPTQAPMQLENIYFLPTNDGSNASIPMWEFELFCNQVNSNIGFDMVKWGNMLGDINNASFENSEIAKRGNLQDMVKSNSRSLEKNMIKEEVKAKEKINEKKLLKLKVESG